MLVVENGHLDAMLRDPALAAEFEACLGPLRAAPASDCHKCGKSAAKDASAYNAAKLCLATMDQARRDRLKEAFRTKQMTIYASNGSAVLPYKF
jgi:hypothetical protein